MTRITEPHWGQPVGRVDAQGNVTISGKFADVMRALVKQLQSTTEAAAEAQAAADQANEAGTPLSITGTNGVQVFGSEEAGFEVRGPGDSDVLASQIFGP